MTSSTTRAFMAKKQSTSFAQVATNLLNVLQGYSKTIRLLLVMFLTLTVTTNAWAADVTCDFTAQSASHGAYTDSWSYGNFTVFGGANNNGGWAYVKMGGKSSNLANANPVYIASPQMTSSISKVQVSIIAGSLAKSGMSVTDWGVYVYSDANMTNQVDYVAGGTITNSAAVFEFTPTSGTTWSANNYYKVSFNLTNTTTTNGIIWLDKITFVESTGGGGGSTPTQLAAPTGLTVGNIPSSGATLSWNAVANASSYIVTIVDGGSLTKDYPVTGITTTVSDLESSTDYLWTVTAVGDGINYTNSEESETGEFTTSAAGGGGGDEECTWELVTDASTLKAGDRVVIAAKEYNYAISTDQGSNNRGQAAITKSENNITWTGSSVQVLTIEADTTSGEFAFNTGDGYLYAASSSKNYMRTETTLSDNSSWEITIADDGTATIVAQGTNTRNTMQYNQSSSIFSCYSSASQKAIVIYKEVCTGGSTELSRCLIPKS